MSNEQTRWFLVSNYGINFPLHQTMISLGKEGCDIILQSRSVDRRHALITFDHYEKRFKVKDLNSINGTYLNEVRIPFQTFVKLEHLDTLRFGFDVTVYQIQRVIEKFPVPVIPNYRHSCAWTPDPYSSHSTKMADCQGCLQKQTIHHTCGFGGSEWSAEDASLRPNPVQSIANQPQNRQTLSAPILTSDRKDTCGNFFSADVARGCCAAPPQPQRLTVSEDLSIENKSCCPRDVSTDGNYARSAYPLPTVEPHPCACTFSPQPSTPSAAATPSGSAARTAHPPKSVGGGGGCSSNTSLQSTFSGDSLDATFDGGAATERRLVVEDATAGQRGSLTPGENAGTNVVPAEKPLSASGRPACTAFTIEFDDEPSAAKKLDIKDSISKFAPPKADSCEAKAGQQRRNPTKRGHRDSGEREDAGGQSWRTTKGNASSRYDPRGICGGGVGGGGYHSDGCGAYDSDNEEGIDDLSAKSEPKKGNDSRFSKDFFEVVGLAVKLAERKADGHSPKPSNGPLLGFRSSSSSAAAAATPPPPSSTGNLRDSTKYLLNKMFGEIAAPTNSPTEPVSPTILSAALHADRGKSGKKPISRRGAEEVAHEDEEVVRSSSSSSARNAPEAENRTEDCGEEEEEEEEEEEDSPLKEDDGDKVGRRDDVGDNVSEAGTYTIESDGKDAEEERRARKDIDDVFGVNGKYATYRRRPAATATTTTDRATTQQTNAAAGKKSASDFKDKETPVWLKEWVALTALENKMNRAQPSSKTTLTPASDIATLQHSAIASAPANEVVAQRQRRRLPAVPPVDWSQQVAAAAASRAMIPTASTSAAAANVATTRRSSDSSAASPDGRRSDSSMDTETILKETENMVSAMEARMDYSRQRRCEDPPSPPGEDNGKDSGGESDVDTSTASGPGANNNNNDAAAASSAKKFSRQVGAALSKASGAGDDSRDADRTYRKNRRDCFRGGRSTPTGGGGEYSEGETASVHSDVSSSSEVSGSSRKGSRTDKAPLMRFNRAFSLRRARLDCGSASDTTAAKPVKATNSRPGSAGSAKEVATPRRATASASKSDGGDAFDRADGGRFSLRLPRSAPAASRTTRTAKAAAAAAAHPHGPPKANAAAAPPPSRCNSTLSAKELEMKNWKRRKEYDPLKAAAQGRRKDAGSATAKSKAATKSETHSPTAPSFTRSASFHGTDGARLRRDTFTTSEDDLTATVGTRTEAPPPPTPPLTPRYPALPTDAFGPGYDIMLRGRTKKSSEDECAYEAQAPPPRAYGSHADLTSSEVAPASSSSRGSPLPFPVHRHKSKIDALDNLVISTIHQVSSNLRRKGEDILKKMGGVHYEESVRCLGVGDLAHLTERAANGDSPDLSPQGGSVSQQVSGILKNMKRLEESLQAVQKILDFVIRADDEDGAGRTNVNGKSLGREDVAKHHHPRHHPHPHPHRHRHQLA